MSSCHVKMMKFRRFAVELIGSFFMAMAIVMSRSSAIHKIEVASLYGALLYSLNTQSGAGATFNVSVEIAKRIAGKSTSGDLFASILGQSCGVSLGAVIGTYLCQNEMLVIIYGDNQYTENITPSQFVSGFLFSFLLCLVGSSAPCQSTISYPIAMVASLVAGGLTADSPWSPFTAFNPLAELMFYRSDSLPVVLLKFTSCLLGGIAGGCYSLFMFSSERSRDDTFIRLSDLTEEAQNTALFDYKSWLVGASVEGIGSFYLTFVFALGRGINEEAWPIAVGATVVALSYLSLGGYFNPAVTVAFYVQDRNCVHPSISTFSMFSYIFSQLLGAVGGAWLALWVGHGHIRIPSVNPLVKPFPTVFISEILFTGLIIVCHMYSCNHPLWAGYDPRSTVLHVDHQSLCTGLATMAALSVVTGLSVSPLNPVAAVALPVSVYLWEMRYGFDQASYGEINYNFEDLWVFFAGPFIASISVGCLFSVTIRMSSTFSRPTGGGESHSPLLEESKVEKGSRNTSSMSLNKYNIPYAL